MFADFFDATALQWQLLILITQKTLYILSWGESFLLLEITNPGPAAKESLSHEWGTILRITEPLGMHLPTTKESIHRKTCCRMARFASGVVVVDAVTAGLASGLVEFDRLGTISVKGKTIPVEVYTPVRAASASVRSV